MIEACRLGKQGYSLQYINISLADASCFITKSKLPFLSFSRSLSGLSKSPWHQNPHCWTHFTSSGNHSKYTSAHSRLRKDWKESRMALDGLSSQVRTPCFTRQDRGCLTHTIFSLQSAVGIEWHRVHLYAIYFIPPFDTFAILGHYVNNSGIC